MASTLTVEYVRGLIFEASSRMNRWAPGTPEHDEAKADYTFRWEILRGITPQPMALDLNRLAWVPLDLSRSYHQ